MGLNLSDAAVALSGISETERCHAVEDLLSSGTQEGIPYLVVALQDRSVRVREAAIRALVEIGGAAVADSTAALLGSEDVALRNSAIEVLEELGEAGLEALEKYFKSSSADVRKFAIDTVGKIASRHKIPPLIFLLLVERLWDANGNVAGAAAEALGSAAGDWAIPYLMDHLSGPNESSWLQCCIVSVLAGISSENSRKALQQIDKERLSEEARLFLTDALSGEVV